MAVFLSPVGGVAAQFFTNTGAVLTGGKIYTYAAGTTTPAVTYTSSGGGVAQPNPIVLDAAGRVPSGGEIWLTDGIIYKFVLKDSTDVLIATYDNITGINSNSVSYTNQQEIQTATAGQTVFNLGISYQVATNSLSVFVDGVNQYGPGAQYAYTETSSTSVTFTNGLHVGAVVKFTSTQQQGAGAVNASQVTYNPAGTGAVATNVQAKLRQTVSVKDFGAVGDGVTDDSAAIQASFDFLTTGGTVYFPNGVYKLTASGLRIKYDNITIMGYGATLYYPTALPTFNDCSSWNGFGGGAAITVAKPNSVQPDPAPGVLPDPGIPVAAASNLITKNFRCFGLRFLSDGDVFANPGVAVANKGAIYYCNADKSEIAECIFEKQHTEPLNGGLVTDSSFHDNVFINGQHGGIALVTQTNCVIENNRFYNVWQPFETAGIQCIWRGNQIISSVTMNNVFWIGTTSRGMGILDNVIENNYVLGSVTGSFAYFEYVAGGANNIKHNKIINNIFVDDGSGNHQYINATCRGIGRAYDVVGNTFDAHGSVTNGSIKFFLNNDDNDIVFKENSVLMQNSPAYLVQLQNSYNASFLCENNVATFPYGTYFATATENLDLQNGWARYPHFYTATPAPEKLQFRNNRVNGYNRYVLNYLTMTPGSSCIVASDTLDMFGNDGTSSYDIARFYGTQSFVLTNKSGLSALIRNNATYLILLTGSNTTLANGASMYFVPIGNGNKYKQIA
jgi:hypothetical protein